jgi:hypothetical protein
MKAKLVGLSYKSKTFIKIDIRPLLLRPHVRKEIDADFHRRQAYQIEIAVLQAIILY